VTYRWTAFYTQWRSYVWSTHLLWSVVGAMYVFQSLKDVDNADTEGSKSNIPCCALLSARQVRATFASDSRMWRAHPTWIWCILSRKCSYSKHRHAWLLILKRKYKEQIKLSLSLGDWQMLRVWCASCSPHTSCKCCAQKVMLLLDPSVHIFYHMNESGAVPYRAVQK
jgi:hypothetical protein